MMTIHMIMLLIIRVLQHCVAGVGSNMAQHLSFRGKRYIGICW